MIDIAAVCAELGITSDTDPKTAHEKYRELVKANHPDGTQDPAERERRNMRMQAINAAYDQWQTWVRGVGSYRQESTQEPTMEQYAKEWYHETMRQDYYRSYGPRATSWETTFANVLAKVFPGVSLAIIVIIIGIFNGAEVMTFISHGMNIAVLLVTGFVWAGTASIGGPTRVVVTITAFFIATAMVSGSPLEVADLGPIMKLFAYPLF